MKIRNIWAVATMERKERKVREGKAENESY